MWGVERERGKERERGQTEKREGTTRGVSRGELSDGTWKVERSHMGGAPSRGQDADAKREEEAVRVLI